MWLQLESKQDACVCPNDLLLLGPRLVQLDRLIHGCSDITSRSNTTETESRCIATQRRTTSADVHRLIYNRYLEMMCDRLLEKNGSAFNCGGMFTVSDVAENPTRLQGDCLTSVAIGYLDLFWSRPVCFSLTLLYKLVLGISRTLFGGIYSKKYSQV